MTNRPQPRSTLTESAVDDGSRADDLGPPGTTIPPNYLGARNLKANDDPPSISVGAAEVRSGPVNTDEPPAERMTEPSGEPARAKLTTTRDHGRQVHDLPLCGRVYPAGREEEVGSRVNAFLRPRKSSGTVLTDRASACRTPTILPMLASTLLTAQLVGIACLGGCAASAGASYRGEPGGVVGIATLGANPETAHRGFYVGSEIGIRKEGSGTSGWTAVRVAYGWTSIDESVVVDESRLAFFALPTVGIDYAFGGPKADVTFPFGVLAPVRLGLEESSVWLIPAYYFHVGDELDRRHELMLTVGYGFMPDICIGPPTVCK